jgi:hypothetical protein
MNSKPVRILFALLLFLVGASSLYSALGRDLDMEPPLLFWISLVLSSLLLFSAYALFRRLAIARYFMYVYSALTLLLFGFIALKVMFAWTLVVAGVFALVTTYYVHQYFRTAEFEPPTTYGPLKESGLLLAFCVLTVLSLLVVSFTQEPTIRTLSGPTSLR